MSTLLIVNETAGQNAFPLFTRLRAEAEALGADVVFTEAPGHAVEIVRKSDADTVLVAGGDDTVREALQGLHGARLGIVPTGSFNVFARALGVPQDPMEALRLAFEARDTLVDLGTLDAQQFNESVGVGLIADAFVNAPGQEVKGWARWLAGATAAWRALGTLHTERFHLVVDDRFAFDFEACDLTVANIGLISAAVPMLPDADPCDGMLDVAVLHAGHPLELLHELPALLHHTEHAGTTFRARKLEIKCEAPRVFRIDGSVTEPRRSVIVECKPGALTLCNAKR